MDFDIGKMYLLGLLFLIITGFFDRMREITIFRGWEDQFRKRHSTWKLLPWFFGDRPLFYVRILGRKIPLHPIFWDGYHFFKGISVLFFCLIFVWMIDWSFIIAGPMFWWTIQEITVRVLIGKYR